MNTKAGNMYMGQKVATIWLIFDDYGSIGDDSDDVQ